MNLHDDQDDIEYLTAMELQMRKISDEQIHQFEGYASEIFSALGMDLNTPATKVHHGDLSRHSLMLRKAMMATRSC